MIYNTNWYSGSKTLQLVDCLTTFQFVGPNTEVPQPCSRLQDACHLVTMQYRGPNSCVLHKCTVRSYIWNILIKDAKVCAQN